MTDLTAGEPHQLLGLYDSPFVRRVAVTMHSLRDSLHAPVAVGVPAHGCHAAAQPPLQGADADLPNGEKLFESAYILDYLDELAGERDILPLTPRSGPERRQVQQLMALAIVATEKAVAIEYERKRPGELQWADWTGRLRGQMRQAFAMLEERLAGDFLVGGRLTQADITTVAGIGFVRYVLPHEWPASDYPALSGLADRLEASAAFKAVPIEE
jgi:glutathione S-transferase